jgi:hypothetical protein
MLAQAVMKYETYHLSNMTAISLIYSLYRTPSVQNWVRVNVNPDPRCAFQSLIASTLIYPNLHGGFNPLEIGGLINAN